MGLLLFLIVFASLVVIWKLLSQLREYRRGYGGIGTVGHHHGPFLILVTAYARFGWLPFAGHALSYGASPRAFVERVCADAKGEPVALQLGNMHMVLVSKSEHVERWAKMRSEQGFWGTRTERQHTPFVLFCSPSGQEASC